jgi:hypothetical protein
MFSIDKRSSFSLKPPEFSCDQPIHKQIVPPLPCTPFFLTITGSAGSGKTSMLVNLLTSPQAYKKAFHAVHCIIPAHSVASLKKNIFAKHPRMHDELNFVTLDRIYEQVMKDAEEKMSSLLIMDDVTASLKNLEIQMLLKKIIFNRRHYRLSIICLVQSYNAMPLAVRKTISHLACYKPRNKKEMAAIWEELIFLDKETGEALQRFVFDKPYSFLFACADTNELYKKFDRILIKDHHAPKEDQEGEDAEAEEG